MTNKAFKQWTKNGNFTLTEEKILQVSNDISEDMAYIHTKKELVECARYWMLHSVELEGHTQMAKSEELAKQVRKLKKEMQSFVVGV